MHLSDLSLLIPGFQPSSRVNNSAGLWPACDWSFPHLWFSHGYKYFPLLQALCQVIITTTNFPILFHKLFQVFRNPSSSCVCHHAPLICPEHCSRAMLASHRPEQWGHWSPQVVGRWGNVHWWCGLPFVQHHSHSCRGQSPAQHVSPKSANTSP